MRALAALLAGTGLALAAGFASAQTPEAPPCVPRVGEKLGVRFVEYRSRLRVLELVRAVEAGQSLSQAAISAGFGSYAQCHRVCAAAFGCSPRDFFGSNPEG